MRSEKPTNPKVVQLKGDPGAPGFGTLRLRIARTRKPGFLPDVLQKFQRRGEEVSRLIREAFLRGISTRQVG